MLQLLEIIGKKLWWFLIFNFSVLFQEAALQIGVVEVVADSVETSGRQASQGKKNILEFAVQQFFPIQMA